MTKNIIHIKFVTTSEILVAVKQNKKEFISELYTYFKKNKNISLRKKFDSAVLLYLKKVEYVRYVFKEERITNVSTS